MTAESVSVNVTTMTGQSVSVSAGDGPCVWGNRSSYFAATLPQDTASFTITGSFDSAWEKQSTPDPDVLPQTHLVRARRHANYTVEYSNGSFYGSLNYTSPTYALNDLTDLADAFSIVHEL
ncbi:MAG: hypothetical protein V2I33_18970 [Kangiellaceae bacterium]|jgi:hypothetical protein|nr:hypothetical protein [Kangiellaceae bacterium]